jgi:hypothetical protein
MKIDQYIKTRWNLEKIRYINSRNSALSCIKI